MTSLCLCFCSTSSPYTGAAVRQLPCTLQRIAGATLPSCQRRERLELQKCRSFQGLNMITCPRGKLFKHMQWHQIARLPSKSFRLSTLPWQVHLETEDVPMTFAAFGFWVWARSFPTCPAWATLCQTSIWRITPEVRPQLDVCPRGKNRWWWWHVDHLVAIGVWDLMTVKYYEWL